MMGSAASSKVKDLSLNVNKFNSKSDESSSGIHINTVPDNCPSSYTATGAANIDNIATTSTSQSDGQSESAPCGNNDRSIGKVRAEEYPDSCQLQTLMERIKTLETELANVQSQNMDYEDQIKDLREQALNNDADQHKTDIQNVLQYNHKRIAELEEEKESSKLEYVEMNLKLRRRVKVLKAKLAESRQMFQMEKMEMSDTIKQLKESNERLPRSQRNHEDDNIFSQNSDRMHLVVELSSQVSEQSQIISDLQNSVAEKNKEIEQLKLRLFGKKKMEETDSADCWTLETEGRIEQSLCNKPNKTYKLSNLKERRGQNDSELSWVKASSNSDSDWSIQSEFISSKIHSAPPGVRA